MAKTKDVECCATIKAFSKEVCELEIYKDESKSKSISKYMIAKGYADPVECSDATTNAILVSSTFCFRYLLKLRREYLQF